MEELFSHSDSLQYHSVYSACYELCTLFLLGHTVLQFNAVQLDPYPSGVLHWQWGNPRGYGEINNMDLMQTTDISNDEQICAHDLWAVLYNEIDHVTAKR